MRIRLFSVLAGLTFCVMFAAIAAAKSSPADYPLRIHIFQFSAHYHYYNSNLDRADGEGRANLYENGEPRGLDFNYECSIRIMASEGYETYMARWKKPGRELEILFPVIGGNPGQTNSCDLKVTLKDGLAFTKRNGLFNEIPAEQFKAWMIKYGYDPEHGKNLPASAPAAGQPAAAPVPAPSN